MAAGTEIDEARLEQFMHQIVGDLGAATSAPLVIVGEQLGLYRAMSDSAPITPAELAERTGTAERYVREWLANQAASGYVEYDPDTATYRLPAEQALALAVEDSPVYSSGAFQIVAAMFADQPHLTEAFRSGDGVGWHEHDHRLFDGTERFFRSGYRAHLVEEWIPSLDGVEQRLVAGARVADIGCGHGASTIIMAGAYPESTFVGFDYHDDSIARAREAAEEAGVADRVAFEVASAAQYPAASYDLVTSFDCLHDMGDPVGAAKHVLGTLADDGTWMVVEPMAGNSVGENLNPVGRLFYAASAQICTPASLAQDVGLALGAQAGEKRLSEVIREGGFGSVRRAATTPFNLVLEARR